MESPLISFDRRFAERLLEAQAAIQPEAKEYSPVQRQKSVRDILLHLQYLDQAMAAESPRLFSDYMQWNQVVMVERGIDENNLKTFLQVLRDHFEELLMPIAFDAVLPYLTRAMEDLENPAMMEDVTVIQPDNPFYAKAQEYLEAVLGSDRQAALMKVNQFVRDGLTIKDIYLHIFQPVQHEIGRLWQRNRISIAQEHYATALTQLAMAQLYPQVFTSERVGFRLVAACVGSELHEVGVRMVADFFEMAGWDTYYLGANVPAAEIIRAVEVQNADLLALSVTLSSQIMQLRDLIQEIRKGVKRDIKVLVGGYPFNVDPRAWQVVGADAYAPDAQSAIDTAFTLVNPT